MLVFNKLLFLATQFNDYTGPILLSFGKGSLQSLIYHHRNFDPFIFVVRLKLLIFKYAKIDCTFYTKIRFCFTVVVSAMILFYPPKGTSLTFNIVANQLSASSSWRFNQ